MKWLIWNITTISFLLCGHIVQSQEDEDDDKNIFSLGSAIESFSPCPNGFIFMEREIGRKPSEENYWDGRIDLKKYKRYNNSRVITIALTLDNEAVITVDPEVARIYSSGLTFWITPYEVPDTLHINVKGSQNKPFPNIASVTVNANKPCKNPLKWNPSFLEPAKTAVGTLETSDFNALCGRKQVEHTELVTNGLSTKHGDWPWHTAIYTYNKKKTSQNYRCGGSLISRRTVITAAHCVTLRGEIISNDLFLVILGKYNLQGRDPGSQEREVSSVHIPKDYRVENLKNDIAVIRLITEVEYNQYIFPICLWPDKSENKDKISGTEGTVVGWGLNEFETLSEQLTVGTMPIVSDSDCLLSYSGFFIKYLNENNFCAGRKNGISACNGDSGGGFVIPLIQPDKKVSWYLRGIVSVSVSQKDKAICDSNHYVIFTDALKFDYFINEYK